MKRKITSVPVVLSLMTTVFLCSCGKAETEKGYAPADPDRVCVLKAPDLDADEFLAYRLHDAADFDIPVSEAIAFMETVYGPGATTYSSDGALNVTSVRKLGRRTYSADDAPAGLYLIELESDGKEGYSICSADKRYRSVFAFVQQGSISDTVENKALAGFIGNMNAILDDSISRFSSLAQARYESAVAKIEAKKEEARREAEYRRTYAVADPIPPTDDWEDPFDFSRCVFDHVDKSDVEVIEHVVPLKTKWEQGDPYNELMPYAKGNEMPDPASFKVPAGCVPVAIAQIMAHYRKGYSVSADMWNKMTEAKHITQLQYPEARTTVQQMIKYIYDEVKATPGPDGTRSLSTNYLPFLNRKGFSYAGSNNYDRTRASSDFSANQILLAVGSNVLSEGQHAWLMNGSRKTIIPEKDVYYCEPKDGGEWYYKTHPNYMSKVYLYVRCEWGYGGNSDGWFSENSLTPSFNGVQRQYKIDDVYYGIK